MSTFKRKLAVKGVLAVSWPELASFMAGILSGLALILWIANNAALASEHVAEKSAEHAPELPADHSGEHSEKGHTPVLVIKKQPSALESLWEGFMVKVDEVRHYDELNEKLKVRVAELEIENAKLRSALTSKTDEKRLAVLRKQSLAEGGKESSRTLASLDIKNPDLLALPPLQIYKKAQAAFEKKNYEVASRHFALLVENEENSAYQDAANFHWAGVSFYKIGNYKKAFAYFERSEELIEDEDIVFAPRNLAWKAVCCRKLNDRKCEKKFIHELIQKYPKSKEARKINRLEAEAEQVE